MTYWLLYIGSERARLHKRHVIQNVTQLLTTCESYSTCGSPRDSLVISTKEEILHKERDNGVTVTIYKRKVYYVICKDTVERIAGVTLPPGQECVPALQEGSSRANLW